MTYDTIIFDMDGVLVENSPGWVFETAAAEAIRAHGVEPTDQDVELLTGFPQNIPAAEDHFREQYGLELADLWRRRERLASINQLRAIRRGEKAVYDDVEVLEDLPTNLAVVSNNQHATVESVVRHFDIERHVDVWFGLEPSLAGIYRRKPDPYYLETAIDDIGGDRPLYIGDRLSDMRAAAYAGMDSALISRGASAVADESEHLPESTPTHEITSLGSLWALIDA